jgi:phosphoribosylanthranilate isomerase
MTMPTPLIKICGVTRPEDAELAVELGADLLGLNFYPPSPRFVETARAVEIARAVAGRVPLVGVFVNRPRDEIEALVGAVGLARVQLHGDEGPEETALFGERAVKVFRRRGLPPAQELAAYRHVWGFLFDVPHATLYGGTGQKWSWSRIVAAPDLAARVAGRPVLVAGGVGPGNAAGILRAAAAAPEGARLRLGLDVCSRVESAPGVKDRDLLERFFSEVRDGQSPDGP